MIAATEVASVRHLARRRSGRGTRRASRWLARLRAASDGGRSRGLCGPTCFGRTGFGSNRSSCHASGKSRKASSRRCGLAETNDQTASGMRESSRASALAPRQQEMRRVRQANHTFLPGIARGGSIGHHSGPSCPNDSTSASACKATCHTNFGSCFCCRAFQRRSIDGSTQGVSRSAAGSGARGCGRRNEARPGLQSRTPTRRLWFGGTGLRSCCRLRSGIPRSRNSACPSARRPP